MDACICTLKRVCFTEKPAIAKSKVKDVAGFSTKIPGRILLQDHGDEVCSRNVKIQSTPR